MVLEVNFQVVLLMVEEVNSLVGWMMVVKVN